ncbi:hypothetical protein GH714_021067 [Hevea brasiliensis]|uniref:Cytochrome P450 n=1 Tax=Hevea brasiliensis TaxID=3981 RepID=A0A6A6NI55_HEVBR|nr:hypothetical protein GH714_021067 [Hevea brasiliensis]
MDEGMNERGRRWTRNERERGLEGEMKAVNESAGRESSGRNVLIANLLQWRKPNSKRLPPGPPRWPIFGNLLQLGQLPHRDLASLCDEYGPLVYLRLGSVDAITTNDPEIIREILLRQDEVFASRPRTLAADHLAYGCGDVALAH